MSATAIEMKSIADLPGPKGWPLLGNLPQVDLSQFHRHLERWCDEYGTIFRVRMGPLNLVCISDAGEINKVLRDRPDVYRRQRVLESVISEMGFNGVFSSEGESWKRQRKVVAMALNSAHIKQFFPNMVATTERLRQRWAKAADKAAPVDLWRDVMRYTVDITTELAFGVNVNTLETDGPVVQQHLDKVFPALGRRINAPFPYWRYIRFAKDREIDHALAEIRTIVEGFIADCRARMAENPSLFETPTNFLEAIIAAQTEEVGADFSDEEVFANVLTLLLAGEDTTATTIAWAVKYFVDHPAHYARARAEVDAVVGSASCITDYAQLGQLPFIEAFANETMRLKPIGPFFPMETNESVELMGYHLPKGTVVVGLTRYVAVDPENFDAPDQFDPDRWVTPSEDRAHNTQAFLPFGTGPRFCPGRNLALAEIKIALAMLARNFNIEFADPGVEVEERMSFTMIPTNLNVVFTPRSND